MVANMEVDWEADKEADMVDDNKKIDIDINMEIQFGERVSHGGWLIGPKLFDPKLTRLAHLLSFASLFSPECLNRRLGSFACWAPLTIRVFTTPQSDTKHL